MWKWLEMKVLMTEVMKHKNFTWQTVDFGNCRNIAIHSTYIIIQPGKMCYFTGTVCKQFTSVKMLTKNACNLGIEIQIQRILIIKGDIDASITYISCAHWLSSGSMINYYFVLYIILPVCEVYSRTKIFWYK